MNIPMSWLRDVIAIPDNTPLFVEKITDVGVKVEGIVSTGQEITNVVVGKIVELGRHPDADKLFVTKADVGGDAPLQIVTGADNLKVGDYIPVALHGATLVNGLKIKKSKMRGLESNGMLCSIGELGCTLEDFPHATEEGIFVFEEPHPLGVDARPIMGLVEDVLDFEILSNRPDTNSVMGIAREVAAVYKQDFSLPAIQVTEKGGDANALVSVDIQDADKCNRYIARVVTNAKIAPSPRWMQKRLNAAGVRPVNNIVDITNYVMLEYGQPLHAFDINAVAKTDGKHGVIIRTARAGEKITTLDGEERKLTPDMLLIADGEKPLAIAGIMGGDSTKITDATTTILFESAHFDAANIRKSSKTLGLRTDASGRYEKGLDPNTAVTSVNRAMELVALLGCGDVVAGRVDNYPVPRTMRALTFTLEEINARLGLNLPAEEITAILRRVDITVRAENGVYTATLPTPRTDITEAVDLAEEVARFYGYNNIPARYVQPVDATPPFTPGMSVRRRFDLGVKNAVASLGYYEALTYPFESPKIGEKLQLPADFPTLLIDNPLGEDFSVMRNTTLGGLLTGLALNSARRNDTARLFELSCTYVPHALPLKELPLEKPFITLAGYGADIDYLAIKGDVEELLSLCVGGKLIFEPLALPYMHPGRTARVSYKPHPKRDAMVLGFLGELHPQTAADFDIESRVALAVLDLDALFETAAARQMKFTPPPKFPALVRDLAFTVPMDVTAAQCEAAIRERGGQLLVDVTLFDVYTGEQIEAGHKSMAYNLRFVAPDRTLTDEAAQKLLTGIRTNLTQKYSAQVR